MKKFVLAVIAVAALGSAAKADPALFNWSGYYAGLNAGWMSRDIDWTFTAAHNGPAARSDSWIAGVHVGAQQQYGNWVLGIEGGFSLDPNKADPFCPNPAFRCETRLNGIWTAGPRVGYAFGNWLVYGTGGYAHATVDTDILQLPSNVAQRVSHDHDGWFGGGGIETALSQNLIFGLEYQHVDFGNKLYDAALPRNVHPEEDSIRARLTWKFGPPFGAN